VGITILSNATIFDGVHPDLVEANIFIEDHRIREVSRSATSSPSAQVIDLNGAFVMPGLIDAHVHAYCPDVDVEAGDRLPLSAVAHRARVMLEGCLRRGFTTVRDVGGADYGLHFALTEGWFTGPRLFYCGKALSQTGGHGDLRQRGWTAPCGCGMGYSGHLSIVVDGPEALRKHIRTELRNGAHFIKFMGSGGVSSATDSLHCAQYSDDEISAIVDEVARHDVYATAHVHPDQAIRRCIELGVHGVEHATFISAETASLAAKAGTAVTPTLAVIEALKRNGEALGYPRVSMDKLAEVEPVALGSLEIMSRAGVTMGFGTDLIGQIHREQCLEFTLRRQVLSPFEILKSATSVNARNIGQGADLGRVQPGYLADLLVLEADPMTDLSVFDEAGSKLKLIMKDGLIVTSQLN